MQKIQELICNRAAGLCLFYAVMMWQKIVVCLSGGSGFNGPVAVARGGTVQTDDGRVCIVLMFLAPVKMWLFPVSDRG